MCSTVVCHGLKDIQTEGVHSSHMLEMYPSPKQKEKKEKNSAVSEIHFGLCSIHFKPLSRQMSIADCQVLTHWDSYFLFFLKYKGKKIMSVELWKRECFCWM